LKLMASARWIVTGEFEQGKTRTCQAVAGRLQDIGWDVAGILSPGVWMAGRKVAIDAVDLRTGKTRRLAVRSEPSLALRQLSTVRWAFDLETLAWCDSVLEHAPPCDLLVVDELGPLELERGAGLMQGLQAADAGEFVLGLLVIRPRLLHLGLERWPGAEVLEVRGPETLAAAIEKMVKLAVELRSQRREHATV
jgi:nucleoside-triphosphatase THEP1